MRTSALETWRPAAAVLVVAALLWVGCARGGVEPSIESTASTAEPATSAAEVPTEIEAGAATLPEGNPETLAEWDQLILADRTLAPADGVVPYALNSALFSDYAHKLRTVSVPDGSAGAVYDDENVFEFPVGTIITKTFYYPTAVGDPASAAVLRVADNQELAEPIDLRTHRLIETRVLVHRTDGWQALPYVWNDDQTEATLARTGDLVRLAIHDDPATTETRDFVYEVPNVNQCSGCHVTVHESDVLHPIGPKARHLNRSIETADGTVDQLAQWQELGLLQRAPADAPRAAVWSDPAADLDARARAYLDINCAHCHNRVGPADVSGLFLEASTDLGPRFGVCKPPIAAGTGTGGRTVGIAPGAPEDSIFVFRLESEDPASMMPEVGRALAHTEGVDLITAWVESLGGAC